MTIYTISQSGSPDYSDPATWESMTQGDLVSATDTAIGEIQLSTDVYSDTSTICDIAGSTTNSSYYRELTCKSGASFIDNIGSGALRYNTSNGAALTCNASQGTVIITESYARLTRLQLNNTHSLYSATTLKINATGTRIGQCITEFNGGAVSGVPLNIYGSSFISSSLVVQRKSGATQIAAVLNGATAVNCTFVCPSDLTASTNGVGGVYSAATLKNCVVAGATNFYTGTTPTCTTCYSSAGSLPSGVTSTTYSTSTGTYFGNISDGTHDYRFTSTSSDLYNNGTYDSTNAPADILDTAFGSGTTSVGCFQYSSSGTIESGAFSISTSATSGFIGASLAGSSASSVGSEIVNVVGASTADSQIIISASVTATFIGAQATIEQGAFSIGATAAFTAVGQSAISGDFSIDATASSTSIGSSTADSDASLITTSASTFTSNPINAASAQIDSQSVLNSIGASLFDSEVSINASSVATFVGSAVAPGASEYSIQSISTNTFASQSFASSDFYQTGQAQYVPTGASLASSPIQITTTAVASFVGNALTATTADGAFGINAAATFTAVGQDGSASEDDDMWPIWLDAAEAEKNAQKKKYDRISKYDDADFELFAAALAGAIHEVRKLD